MKTIWQKHRWKALCAVVLVIAVCAALCLHRGEKNPSYAKEKADTVAIEQTLTAAGEIKAYKTKKIHFDTDLVYAAMCVEVGDAVEKGDPLIQYSDGSFTYAKGNGVITKIAAPATGDYATSSNYIKLAYTDSMILKIKVPEDEINRVHVGDKATIVVNADTSKSYEGTIVSVKAVPDEDDGGYTVKIRLKNDGTLRIGMSASSTITVSSRSGVLTVPVEAVQFDDEDKAYVNVSENGKVVRRSVTTGESDADNVEITEGLKEGDVVLVEE